MTAIQQEQIRRAMKSLRFAVKDAEKGTVEAVFSTFNVKDLDDDVTVPGAFEDGAEVLISAYGHASWGGALPVGKGVVRCDDVKAWLDGQFFLDTMAGSETWKTIKGTGDLQEWSYGYDVLETGEVTEAMRQSGVWRVIKKAKVWEVSPVLVGAGIGTGTLSVKSAERRAHDEAAAGVSTDARRELARFSKIRSDLVARS